MNASGHISEVNVVVLPICLFAESEVQAKETLGGYNDVLAIAQYHALIRNIGQSQGIDFHADFMFVEPPNFGLQYSSEDYLMRADLGQSDGKDVYMQSDNVKVGNDLQLQHGHATVMYTSNSQATNDIVLPNMDAFNGTLTPTSTISSFSRQASAEGGPHEMIDGLQSSFPETTGPYPQPLFPVMSSAVMASHTQAATPEFHVQGPSTHHPVLPQVPNDITIILRIQWITQLTHWSPSLENLFEHEGTNSVIPPTDTFYSTLKPAEFSRLDVLDGGVPRIRTSSHALGMKLLQNSETNGVSRLLGNEPPLGGGGGCSKIMNR